MIKPGSIVVAYQSLNANSYSQKHKGRYAENPHADSHGCNSIVSIGRSQSIGKTASDAHHNLTYRRGDPDLEDFQIDISSQADKADCRTHRAGTLCVMQHIHQDAHGITQYCGNSSTTDSHLEYKDKQGIKDDVYHRSYYHAVHGSLGCTFGSEKLG